MVYSHEFREISEELRAQIETQANKWSYVDIASVSRVIYSMSSFLERKDHLAHSRRDAHSYSDVHLENPTLLVLDGRHMIYDNIPFSERMAQTLTRNNVAFIASENYYHTLNVIRPHFIRFVHCLNQIARPFPVHLGVYVNAINMTEEDADELLPVLVFLELCFDVNQNQTTSFRFEAVIRSAQEHKSDNDLMKHIPFYAYAHALVVDHHGLNAWTFENKTSAVAERRKRIPIEIGCFDLNQHLFDPDEMCIMDDAFHTLLSAIGFKVHGIKKRLLCDYTRKWIKIYSHWRIICDQKRRSSIESALASSVLQKILDSPKGEGIASGLGKFGGTRMLEDQVDEQTFEQTEIETFTF
eukprot:953954_1